jgi:hypothetical protein
VGKDLFQQQLVFLSVSKIVLIEDLVLDGKTKILDGDRSVVNDFSRIPTGIRNAIPFPLTEKLVQQPSGYAIYP